MGSDEQKKVMGETAYALARELGHPNTVTFAMISARMGCSTGLVKAYLTNLTHLRKVIHEQARIFKDTEMLALISTLKLVTKETGR